MKQVSKISLIGVGLCLCASLWAQVPDGKKTDGKTPDKKELPKIKYTPVYLGHSNLDGGNVTKRVFDSLLKQGVTSRDSAGRNFKVTGFAFSYAERNLYEDSVGTLMILTDYLTEYCFGDTLSSFLLQNITDRSKSGDTVYFDQLSLISPEGTGANGKYMKFVLVK